MDMMVMTMMEVQAMRLVFDLMQALMVMLARALVLFLVLSRVAIPMLAAMLAVVAGRVLLAPELEREVVLVLTLAQALAMALLTPVPLLPRALEVVLVTLFLFSLTPLRPRIFLCGWWSSTRRQCQALGGRSTSSAT